MKVTWTPQIKTDDPKKALEMSIAKWRFFTYCTKAQFAEHEDDLSDPCGLCFFPNGNCAFDCKRCVFGTKKRDGYSCHSMYKAAIRTWLRWDEGEATLKDFHVAARKVWEKLKSLR